RALISRLTEGGQTAVCPPSLFVSGWGAGELLAPNSRQAGWAAACFGAILFKHAQGSEEKLLRLLKKATNCTNFSNFSLVFHGTPRGLDAFFSGLITELICYPKKGSRPLLQAAVHDTFIIIHAAPPAAIRWSRRVSREWGDCTLGWGRWQCGVQTKRPPGGQPPG
ncbi:MAG: hypothetical protein MN733_41070, partial [Nitrososphaera sp.]|nr:hypothetical protein [Nitrososphaera sp.]